ncbi:multifunctional CCA tRNA nucleotidyl transferase/2'3'-cyclic phosphodiesterase/2'nucleotidase/phosphatase [Rhodanobacter thiooxydans]|uniref:Multifunctional CCA protein n=1 Tax=Rhodanobacter thiooxydans TaxID=416169 RepID=A0A154QGL4_9GAMM|nr:multifunctional CCA addition/repair protein [Rhodanobacter thiooxydans]EIM03292.1 multifunctional tRNA nucleotidyl transferase/2'3'-cyclic phosphodiesterase/2'nucleotidase/phosphatase [Rhodanobacter thiooxydans LCS2]KZC23345.1 multifunctional CCA tRNA nucleotidyl transferase/2'3'-cyclic phosphodiesterase/2'nucleotidase/phosphatase [Rhodanobacter thiooxydans]MCW0201225.1 multifunctional CCA addition/repair protein [Rhodanobacter thiooxydans]
MHIFLVGGAVRDKLLNRPVVDRDHVVVGATPEQLLALGYKPVGKDFPVFLHPATGEEYALARTERKSGRGYHGFVFQADPTITLEQDLARRDLTINAIAEDEHGALTDPFGGVRDIEARLLRHASPAFVEDPVRVLRVARFAARFAPLGFTVAAETMALMRQMVADGEVDYLVPERVWAETRKALGEPQPSMFLRVLRECGALAVLFPEVDALYGVPQRTEFHPEIDTGVHMELVLDAAARLAPGNDVVGFCALTHDLGKALTPAAELPRHIGHEHRGVAPLRALAARLKVPTEHATLAELVCREHLNVHRALELKPATVLKLLGALDALRRPARLELFLAACEADKRGRRGHEHDAYPQADYLRAARTAAAAVESADFVARGLAGPAIGKAMEAARIHAIAALRTQPSPRGSAV